MLKLFSAALLATAWYPGFTGTGQVAPAGNGGSTIPSTGCNSTLGYVGYGDCLASGVTVQRYFGLRAYSYAAAQAGAYLARIYGDGAAGDAATSVYADVPAKPDGTPNWGAALLSNGSTGSILPGAGTAATNPCFGGDTKCRVGILYDQTTQTSTASTGGATATTGTASLRPVLAQNCQNNVNVTTIPSADTRACVQSTPNQSLQDSSISAAATQPYSLGIVAARASGSTSNYGLVAIGTASISTYTPANTWAWTVGSTRNTFSVTDGAPATVEVASNGSAGFLQVNGTTTSNVNWANSQSGGTMFLNQASAGAVFNGVTFEWVYATGVWDAAHLAAEAGNKDAYYSLGF